MSLLSCCHSSFCLSRTRNELFLFVIFNLLTFLGAPFSPSNLRPSNITTSSLTLTWDAPPYDSSSEVAQYFIDVKEEQDLDFTPAGRVDGHITSFKTESLRKGKLYRFRVRAKNSVGFSEPPAELREPVGLLDVVGEPYYVAL